MPMFAVSSWPLSPAFALLRLISVPVYMPLSPLLLVRCRQRQRSLSPSAVHRRLVKDLTKRKINFTNASYMQLHLIHPQWRIQTGIRRDSDEVFVNLHTDIRTHRAGQRYTQVQRDRLGE